MWFSPIAAFSAMAYLIGHFGLNTLWGGMINLLLVMLFSCCLFIFGILGIICYFAKINIFKFYAFYLKRKNFIVFAYKLKRNRTCPTYAKLEKAEFKEVRLD